MSGSVATVAAGQLLVMASGAAADVDAATPVLSAFAARVIRVGDAGQGQAMKLAVNLVVHDLNSAVSESLVLAEGAGIDPATAYDVLENSAVGAPFVRYKRAAFLEADQPVAMSLDLVAKDFRLIAELAAGQAQGGAGECRRTPRRRGRSGRRPRRRRHGRPALLPRRAPPGGQLTRRTGPVREGRHTIVM